MLEIYDGFYDFVVIGKKQNIQISKTKYFVFQIQQHYTEIRRKGQFQNRVYCQISQYYGSH